MKIFNNMPSFIQKFLRFIQKLFTSEKPESWGVGYQLNQTEKRLIYVGVSIVILIILWGAIPPATEFFIKWLINVILIIQPPELGPCFTDILI